MWTAPDARGEIPPDAKDTADTGLRGWKAKGGPGIPRQKAGIIRKSEAVAGTR
jgi:hypothetical protein